MSTTLTIRLTRLPDINADRDLERYGYYAYGRFALLRNGSLWFGELRSSHPSNTAVGFYWALESRGVLLVSARGAGIDGEMLISDRRDILAWLAGELVRRRVIRKPGSLRIDR
jgi:hypothetical protein